MPCYRQERFVAAAVHSILAQDCAPLDIVIADDASPDGTAAAIDAALAGYTGPHRVRLLREGRNRGIETLNLLADAAEGSLLVHAHGDDIAHPDRVARLVATWQATGASMVTSNALLIDAEGREIGRQFEPDASYDLTAGSLCTLGWTPFQLGATFACEPDIYRAFPPLSRDRSPVEDDWQLPFRAALLKGIAVVREPLLRHRLHHGSATRLALGSGDSDDPALQEAHWCQRCMQFVYMLETAEWLSHRHGNPGALVPIRARLGRSVVEAATRWSGLRAALRNAGRHPVWQPMD